MQFPISLLVYPLFFLNAIATSPDLPSEVTISEIDTPAPLELDYSYGYNSRRGEAPTGGTGRRRIMA